MRRAGIGVIAVAVALYAGAIALAAPARGSTNTTAERMTQLSVALAIAGFGLVMQARRANRAPQAPAGTGPLPPPMVGAAPSLSAASGGRFGPGAPVTLIDAERPAAAAPPLDPSVEYHGDGLATVDGVLVELGRCTQCGAPNVVLTNGNTGIRYLACSTFPACEGRDRLRRATRTRSVDIRP